MNVLHNVSGELSQRGDSPGPLEKCGERESSVARSGGK